MSIATLARKSRAQRGASTRTGWTLATNANGGGRCHGPCNGIAPAKQKSFRRLMKNKVRTGVEYNPQCPEEERDPQSMMCCPPVAAWKKTNNPKGEQSIGHHIWRKKQHAHNCFHNCIPERQQYNEHYIYVSGNGYYQKLDDEDGGKKHYPPYKFRFRHSEMDIGFPATPVGNYNWWAAKVSDCKYDYEWRLFYHPGNPAGTAPCGWRLHVKQIRRRDGYYERWVTSGQWLFGGCTDSVMPPQSSATAQPPPSGNPDHDYGTLSLSWNYRLGACHTGTCNNTGCKCNCNKSMGGKLCCVVHKTMLPLSNSENIPWVIEERTCIDLPKAAPTNPHNC